MLRAACVCFALILLLAVSSAPIGHQTVLSAQASAIAAGTSAPPPAWTVSATPDLMDGPDPEPDPWPMAHQVTLLADGPDPEPDPWPMAVPRSGTQLSLRAAA